MTQQSTNNDDKYKQILCSNLRNEISLAVELFRAKRIQFSNCFEIIRTNQKSSPEKMYQLNLINIIILLIIKLENSVFCRSLLLMKKFYYRMCMHAFLQINMKEKHIILYRIRLDNIECKSG